MLLDIVRSIYPDMKAAFCDTGMEYPEIRKFVKTFDNVDILHPIKYDKKKKEWVRTNFREVIINIGYLVFSKEISLKVCTARNCPDRKCAKRFEEDSEYFTKYNGRYYMGKYKYLLEAPFKISDQCCKIMKKNPFKHYEKENKMSPILGIMASESATRKTQWQRYGCNIFGKNRHVSRPLSFWTDQDILEYIIKYNINYPKGVYGEIKQNENGEYYCTKRSRSGCMWCLAGLGLEKEPNRLQLLKIEYPHIYNQCMKPLDEGGLGLKDVIDWINEHGNLRKEIKY